jgi:hypothetical protein
MAQRQTLRNSLVSVLDVSPQYISFLGNEPDVVHADYRSDVRACPHGGRGVLTSFTDWKAKPAVAVPEDPRGPLP